MPHLDALAWHRHEMLFGFVGAAIAGFILTAVPNWTGRLPIAGWPLAFLAAGWLAARFLPLAGVGTSVLYLVFDAGFYVVLSALLMREILLAKNRNMPVAILILLFGIADGLDLAANYGWLPDPAVAVRCGLALVVMLIGLIGGRITPSFTRNWMMKAGIRDGLPAQPDRFDRLVLLMTAAALGTFIVLPDTRLTGTGLLLAALFQCVRLARWRGWRTLGDPLVAILHVGYGWVPVGLALLGLAQFVGDIPVSAAIHALTAGAMATMIMAVMSRATLGHTGRELRADMLTVAAYVAISIAAVVRVAAPIGLGDYTMMMRVSGLFWIGAFGLFLLRYGPMLVAARVDGRP